MSRLFLFGGQENASPRRLIQAVDVQPVKEISPTLLPDSARPQEIVNIDP